MNNKKLIRNIIISVVVLAALVGLLVWVNSIPDKEAENGKDDNETVAEEIEIYKFEADDVKSIKIENEKVAYTIVKSEDGYTISGNPDILYSSSKLGYCFGELSSLVASKAVSIDSVVFEKSSQVTICLNDGIQHELFIGSDVIGENAKFVKYEGKLYAVPSYRLSYVEADLNSFRDTALGTISADIASMKILENGKELVSFRKMTDKDAESFNVSATYVMDYPKYLAVSSDRLQSLFEAIGEGYSLSVSGFVDDNISNASKYGIGKKTVIINDGENEYRLDYGNKDENGNIYTVVNNGKSVYAMSSTLFDIIDKYTGNVLMDKLTHIANLDDIKHITFDGKGSSFKLERKGNEDNYSYEINGESVDEDTFKSIYREIIGINSDKIAYNGVAGQAEYTVTIVYPDGKTEKWEYVSESERSYVLSKNGQAVYICPKKNVDAAVKNIKKQLDK